MHNINLLGLKDYVNWRDKIVGTVRVEMFPAKNGDSLLISFLGESNKNILIDLAYPYTYKNFVKSRLLELNSKGESLDLVVFTHIDQDHVHGGITFFRENGESNNPKIIKVKEVWHNSYRHLFLGDKGVSLNQQKLDKIKKRVAYIEESEVEGSEKISGRQGTWLGALLHKGNYPWNTSYNNEAIAFSPAKIEITDEIKITVLSPTEKQLVDLRNVWYKELRRLFPSTPLTNEIIFDDVVEYINKFLEPKGVANITEKASLIKNINKLADTPFVEDPDEINASSITFIVEYCGKKLLFLGDSPPTLIEEQLKRLYRESDFPIYFDLIKVSHHGSEFNTNKSLLNLIDSKRYLISTDGSIHGHPNEATIARIVVRESKQFKRELYMSYPTKTSEIFNIDQWKRDYNYEINTALTGKSTIIEF